jgi:hypothetical protein
MHGILVLILLHLHLTMLEPVIKDALVIARNPVVRKDVGAAVKVVSAYEKQRHKKNR